MGGWRRMLSREAVGWENASMDIGFEMNGKNGSADGVDKNGMFSVPMVNTGISFKLTDGGKSLEDLKDLTADKIAVEVNGYYTDAWYYNYDMGVIVIDMMPGIVHDVRVTLDYPSFLDNLVDFFTPDANAATISIPVCVGQYTVNDYEGEQISTALQELG